MDWTKAWRQVVENASARRVPVSEFNRGSVCGYSGADLPYDVPLDSEFAVGWRHGRELYLTHGRHVASPLFGETAEIQGRTYVRSSIGQWLPTPSKGNWALTWPEGCEGAAAHIPGMSRADVARVREEGGPLVTTQ
jgi:hypothetical protein